MSNLGLPVHCVSCLPCIPLCLVLQFCAAGDLLSALQLLVALMQSRYSCSLAEDEVQLARLAELPAKLAAAVIARSSEKRVLQQLAEVGEGV